MFYQQHPFTTPDILSYFLATRLDWFALLLRLFWFAETSYIP
jgi:cellobiose-specific phosphotransferase system component IIC